MTYKPKFFATIMLLLAAVTMGIATGCGGHDNSMVPPTKPTTANAVPGARFSAIPSNGTKMVIKN